MLLPLLLAVGLGRAIAADGGEASQRLVDPARAEAAGLRRIDGNHITLYTDLPATVPLDDLATAFDAAYGQWCDYFGVPEREAWRVTGYLMAEAERFRAAGLLPEQLPPFENGYSYNHELWLHEQPTDYYRRHLLLHEGVHSFMNTTLGHCGPPWYMEGIAELLATHAEEEGMYRVRHFPRNREEVPMLGRIKLLQDSVESGRHLSLDALLQFEHRNFWRNDAYAWVWGAAAFLDGHPRYRDRFRTLPQHVRSPKFNEQFRKRFADDWDQLNMEWQLFVAELEHAHDLERTAIDFTPGEPFRERRQVTVRADWGWQNSRLQVEKGTTYRLRAEGRYSLGDEPQTWWCEPGGVTLRYYRGQPLGILQAAVYDGNAASRDEREVAGQPAATFLDPLVVGLGTQFTPRRTGTLYLRVNDSPGELDDNRGTLRVEIEPR